MTGDSSAASGEGISSGIRADRLRCEYLENPVGIDVEAPRLSWVVSGSGRGVRQTAYRILAASTAEGLDAGTGDLWDSGRVESSSAAQIPYEGAPVGSRTRVYWKVRIWDGGGRPSPWSQTAFWETGILRPEEWIAEWIALPQPEEKDPLDLQECRWIWYPEEDSAAEVPAGTRYFRRTFDIPPDRTIVQARILMDADDRFTLFANGIQASSDDITTQQWQVLNEINLRRHLRPGRNCLAVRAVNREPGPAGLVGRLRIDFEEGPPLILEIDRSWKTSREAPEGWTATEFDDSDWDAPYECAPFGEGIWGEIDDDRILYQPCPFLRREFPIRGTVRRAVVSATALGLYELRLNGRRVGDAALTPGWTDYHQRIQVQSWDVTEALRPGNNVLGAVLGDGWYAGNVAHVGRFQYGRYPLRFLLQLHVEYADGSSEEIVSDGRWRGASGPIRYSDLQKGELYDARLEEDGWDRPGFDDAGWRPVETLPLDSAPVAGRLVAQRAPLVRVMERIRPVDVRKVREGVFIFDLGQNIAGRCRLRVRGGTAGTEITLRHGEMLQPDGELYTENLRGVEAMDRYVVRGDRPEEIYEPRFTVHGFRYVEMTGYPGTPDRETIEGCVLYSSMPVAGGFETSSELLNRLQHNLNWSLRANFISVPTDCPQRNERMGWTGDAQIFAPAATFNRETAAFFTKWTYDILGAQDSNGAFCDVAPRVRGIGAGNNAWGDAGVLIPWLLHRFYGDQHVVRESFEAMKRWIEFQKATSDRLIRPDTGYGDWLSVGEETPRPVMNTAYFERVTRLFARMAASIGRMEEARRYGSLADRIRKAFQDAFVQRDGRILGDTQTAYALAIDFDLLDEPLLQRAGEYLVENIRSRGGHLSTGFVGTASIMPALLRTGHTDVFYELLDQRSFPSWGFMIDQGATTMWERWNSWTPDSGMGDASMNSFNHYAFGAVGEWFYRGILGIETDPDTPGFARIRISPHPGGRLRWARGYYDSVRGRIEVSWRRKDGIFELDTSIPPNTTALVAIPAAGEDDVTESGKPLQRTEGLLRKPGVSGGRVLVEIGSGSYRFRSVRPDSK